MSDDSLIDSAIDTARDAARDHLAVLRGELARSWRDGSHEPGAETGRRLGLGLTLSAVLLGAGLAFYSAFSRD
jgi:hypothetical protein